MKKTILVTAMVLSAQVSFGSGIPDCPSAKENFIGSVSCEMFSSSMDILMLTGDATRGTKELFTKKQKKVLKAATQGAVAILNSNGSTEEVDAIVQNDANLPAAILVLAQKGIQGSAIDAAQLILEHSKDI